MAAYVAQKDQLCNQHEFQRGSIIMSLEPWADSFKALSLSSFSKMRVMGGVTDEGLMRTSKMVS